MMQKSRSQVRCGIVLAAGEGKRLQAYIQRLRGKDLPKQFVNFIGTRSMLEHTFHRAERLIPSDRLFTVVDRDHLKHPEVGRQLSGCPRENVILQPQNKETGPGIFLPLMHLHKHYPESVVVVFPSDHFILEEDLFMDHVDRACRTVEREPSRLILLGMEPSDPEPEYGYILPIVETNVSARWGVRKVSRFVEKPELHAARELFYKGGLWNTMVMVFKAGTLLELTRKVAPILHRSFQRIRNAVGTPAETEVTEKVYRNMEPVNFSKGLLEAFSVQYASCLGVLPVRGVFWSDWGSEQRIKNILRMMNPMTSSSGRQMVRSLFDP
ncbi:MAG: NTP transferase domain-containing protein [Nitrospirae bacterium]|nr:NTP transferase domain-containing protein [Nitrospirota bacterium]